MPRHVDRMDGIDRADIGQDRTFPAIPVTVTSYSLLDVTPDPLRYDPCNHGSLSFGRFLLVTVSSVSLLRSVTSGSLVGYRVTAEP